MVYTPQQIAKAEKLSATYAPLVADQLVLPSLFAKHSMDAFKGAKDDTISIKVPGVLAAHEYEWRNNRATPIQVDQFIERKINVTAGGNAYSAVDLTDEQKDFDEIAWTDVLPMQADAVADYLNHAAVKALLDKKPAVTISASEGSHNMRKAIFGARSVLNSFRTGTGSRVLIVGSNFEMAMQMDEKLTLADAVGQDVASSAVREATVGRIAGFNVIVDETIDPDDAYAATSNAFMFFNAAPSVPSSAPYGKTTSFGGLGMRHIVDYDVNHFTDRSVVNTWFSFAPVTDIYRLWKGDSKKSEVGEQEHFTRVVKLSLKDEAAFTGTTELTSATKVNLARVKSISTGKGGTPVTPPTPVAPAAGG